MVCFLQTIWRFVASFVAEMSREAYLLRHSCVQVFSGGEIRTLLSSYESCELHPPLDVHALHDLYAVFSAFLLAKACVKV